VAILWDVRDKAASETSLVADARVMKLELRQLDIANVADFERAFGTAKQWSAGAVLLVEGPRAVVNRALIAELALKHRLPVMGQFSRLVEAGGNPRSSSWPSIGGPPGPSVSPSRSRFSCGRIG
jgi:hypothetical protein